MKHDPRLARLNAPPIGCRCPACARFEARNDVADTIACAIAGLVVAIPCAAALLLIHYWPAIRAAAETLYG